jgi:hypothetical protein
MDRLRARAGRARQGSSSRRAAARALKHHDLRRGEDAVLVAEGRHRLQVRRLGWCAGVEPKPLIQPFGERLSFKHNLVQRCVRSACVCGLICFCVSCGWELVPRTSAAPPLGGRGSAAEHTGLPGADVRKVPAQMCAKSWRRCVQSPGADVGSAGTADRRKCGADVRRALHGTCGRGRMRGAVLGNHPQGRQAQARRAELHLF